MRGRGSALLREGTPPGEIAVVFRDPQRYASMVEQVFGAYGIPYSIDRSVPFAHTALGHGLLALLRCAVLEGTPTTCWPTCARPGCCASRAWPTASKPRCAAGAIARPRGPRALGGAPEPLAAGRDRPAARAPGRAALLPSSWPPAGAALHRALPAPGARAAGRRAGRPARVRAGHEALAELRAVVDGRPGFAWTPAACTTRWPSCRSGSARSPSPDRVQVASPLAIRARRFAAVFVCGLQENEFPAGPLARGVPARRRPARHRPRQRVAPAAARGPPGARALPVLRLRLPGRARAGAEHALLRRGGQPAGVLVLPRRRAGGVARPRRARARARWPT